MKVTDLRIDDEVIVTEHNHDQIYRHEFEGTVCHLMANDDYVGIVCDEEYFPVHIDNIKFKDENDE